MANQFITVDGKLLMTEDSKLVTAPDEENLNDLMDEQDEITTLMSDTIDETTELLINGVIDGSPRGVYDNLSALQTALPNGAVGVYLTKDNGYWYYWNGTEWKDGGVYRSNLTKIYNVVVKNDGTITTDFDFIWSDNKLKDSIVRLSFLNISDIYHYLVFSGTDGAYAEFENNNFKVIFDGDNETSRLVRNNFATNDKLGDLTNLPTWVKDNLVGAINELNNDITQSINEVNKNTNKNNLELTDLKEALYGYVLDTAPIDITSTIPTTTTISDTTYNLVDNVRGLIESINGNTVKSENLLVLEDVEETTTNGITYSVKNGVITLNGTATGWVDIDLFVGTLNGSYTFAPFFSGTVSAPNIIRIAENGTYTQFVKASNVTINNPTKIQIYFDSGITLNNVIIKPMLVSGTTAPTEFKQGFNGLKSVEYEGLNIKGANLINIQDIAETTINGITYSVNNGVVKLGGTANNNTRLLLELSSPISAGNYSYNQFVKLNGYNIYLSSDNAISNIQLLLASYNTNGVVSNITTTFEANYLYFYIPKGASFDTHSFTPMLIKGTTAPSEFKPYNSNAFNTILPFNTTLRGAGTAKEKIVISKNSDNDYYTATKVSNMGVFDLGTFSYSITTSGLFESNNLMGIAKGPQTSFIKGNILCSIYSVINSNSISGPSGTNPSPNMVMAIAVDGKLYFNNLSYTNASDFKNAMQGVMLVYELAEPTTEVLSTNLTESQVMPLLELGGSVEIINSNSDFVNGTTTIEMVYKLINS